MFKHKYIAERADRRTYLKGRFRGKFTGKLDQSSSDPRRERYYDLEITEGEIETRQDHLVPWMERKEPDEFAGDTVFPTRLPGKINVTLHYLNGEIKHFKIGLKQIKLKDCHLSGQVYSKGDVYGNIEGLISGYVLHHDMLVKEIAEEPLVVPPPSRDPEPDKKEKIISGRPPISTALTTEPSPARTHVLRIVGGLLGLGLLVAALFIVKHWMVTLLGVTGAGLLIRWLKKWTTRRYNPKAALTVTIVSGILVFIGFVFYLAVNYQNFTPIRTNKTKPLSISGITDLKRKAADFLEQNYYQDALEIYNQLLEIEANNSSLHYQRALCYTGLERITEAVEDLRLLISKGDTAAIALHDHINPIKKRQIGTVIRCNDGTISRSKKRRGTCSGHDGVKNWEEPVIEEYREY